MYTKLHDVTTQQTIIIVLLASGVPSGDLGCSNSPEISKVLQNRVKLNPIVKTDKNC